MIERLRNYRSRWPILHGESVHHTSKTPPLRDNGTVSSTDDIPTCESLNDGPLATKSDGDWWDDKEAEAHEGVGLQQL